MAVLGAEPLDRRARGVTGRGELLAQPLAERPGEGVDLADGGPVGGHHTIEAEKL
jgi:hypothetical protein